MVVSSSADSGKILLEFATLLAKEGVGEVPDSRCNPPVFSLGKGGRKRRYLSGYGTSFRSSGLLVSSLVIVAAGLSGCDGTPCDSSGLLSPCPAGTFCKVVEGPCDGPGVCTSIPDACIEIFQPVCGCNGETYSNSCFAEAAGVNVADVGECAHTDCCDPALEPGTGENPTCVEGTACCADGEWACNIGSGASACETLCGAE